MNSRKHAIVIGGSMAGLLAARVLSDHFEKVTIFERDSLSQNESYRRGVPHGCHAHGLLNGGLRVIEKLFPGITNDLIAHGGVPVDPLNDGHWFFEGGPLKECRAMEQRRCSWVARSLKIRFADVCAISKTLPSRTVSRSEA